MRAATTRTQSQRRSMKITKMCLPQEKEVDMDIGYEF